MKKDEEVTSHNKQLEVIRYFKESKIPQE